MIELKEIVVERYSCSTDSIANKDIHIELSAPFNLNIHEFHRNFQRMLDMQNRELNNRQFLGSGETFESSFTTPRIDSYSIRKIYHNKEKGTTVVCFYSSIRWLFYIDRVESEGKKIIVKLDSEDHDDIYMAVASAVMIRKYKSNSQFKAHIRRSMPKGFDGRPDVYQMMAAAEVSDIYGSWEKFCEIVDEKLEVYHGKRTQTVTR